MSLIRLYLTHTPIHAYTYVLYTFYGHVFELDVSVSWASRRWARPLRGCLKARAGGKALSGSDNGPMPRELCYVPSQPNAQAARMRASVRPWFAGAPALKAGLAGSERQRA